jgi:P4 family phage/plasmid primase-like protien
MNSPYKDWALTYLELGWSPIPLPVREKMPVPKDPSVTGAEGVYVTREMLTDARKGWLHPKARVSVGNLVYPPGNIALRLPKNVLGIDVDAYDGKAGAATLAAAEAAWGKLPDTWATGNRPGDPVSGLRLYQLPAHALGLAWPGELPQGKGVELIRWDHRYAMVAPSQHDKAPHRPYFWRAPDGALVWLHNYDDEDPDAEIELPTPEALEVLPDEWVQGLTAGRSYEAGRTAGGRNNAVGDEGELPDAEVQAWCAGRDAKDGPRGGLAGAYANGMCPAMERTLNNWLLAVRRAGDDGGAHDAARNGAWALLGDSHLGHYGLITALKKLKAAFAKAVEGRRKKSVVDAEWKRIVVRGVSKVATEDSALAEHDSCAGAAKGSGGRRQRTAVGGERAGQTVNEFPSNDKGSALRLMQFIGDNTRWVPSLGGWMRWESSESRWVLDVQGNWIQGQVFAMEAELRAELFEMQLTYEEGAGEVKKADLERFAKYVHSLGNVNKVRAATDAVKLFDGMYVPGDRFDSNPRYLLCSNGVAVLGDRLSVPPVGEADVNSDAGIIDMAGTRRGGTPAGLSFRPAQREDYLSLTTGYPYDPDTRHVMWDEFLKRAVPDETQLRWMQKAVGYSLLGANPERLFFVVMGKTSSGKSTFLEAIRHALGQYAATFELSLFKGEKEQGPNVQKVRVLPKRFIVASEASGRTVLHADEVKKSVGNEAQSARLNNSNEMVTRIPAYTPWLSTNDSPRIPGADSALWRRMIAIPFDQTIPKDEEDAGYADRLREHASPAILAWCLQGWDMYAREGLSDTPASVMQATLKMRGELDDLDMWLSDACTVEPGNLALTALGHNLYEAYDQWCQLGNMKPMPEAVFGRALVARDMIVERKRDGGTRVKVWSGIALGAGQSAGVSGSAAGSAAGSGTESSE